MLKRLVFKNYVFGILLFLAFGCKKAIITDLEQFDAIAPPKVLVNGVPLVFKNAQPTENEQLVMVPARIVFERLGYTCSTNFNDSSLVCINGENSIVFIAGELEAIYNQIPVYQLATPYFVDGELLVEARFLKNLEAILLEWDEESRSLQLYNYDELDYGLYFYASEPNGGGDWDATGCQKYVAGEENPYFDPTKPTIIWIHGWQSGGVEAKSRPSFHLVQNGVDKYTHNQWIEEGWNVAIFHWVPLADELLPFDAESKINAATNNSVDMRWKKADGSFVTDINDMPDVPASQLFANAYAQLAQYQENPTIRLVGSSFGGQMALHGTERLINDGVTPLPSRIALLDMAWTFNYVDNQALYTTEITERAITAISPIIPVEYYRSSLLTTLFTPDELVNQAAFQEMVFDYAGDFGIEVKHTIITYHYFWSLEYDAPIAVDEIAQPVGSALSAATDDATLRDLMGSTFHWQHTQGIDSYDPGDDIFERQEGPQ